LTLSKLAALCSQSGRLLGSVWVIPPHARNSLEILSGSKLGQLYSLPHLFLIFWGITIFISFFLFLFFSFFWGGVGQRERERENLKQAPGLAWGPMRGSVSQSQEHDLSQNQESDV